MSASGRLLRACHGSGEADRTQDFPNTARHRWNALPDAGLNAAFRGHRDSLRRGVRGQAAVGEHGTWYRASSGRRMYRRLVPLSSRRAASRGDNQTSEKT
eukprot:scaffold30408_cov69-Phaeocystis_antarctica.AAC.3